jgi:hypothetical protein
VPSRVLFSVLAVASLLFLCPRSASAQQSLFNVPGTVATPGGEVFAQEQLNFTTRGISNLTVDAGLGAGFEIGVNVFDVTLYDTSEAVGETPLSLLNAAYTIDVGALLTVQLGVQAGIAARGGANPIAGAGYGWASMRFHGGDFGDYVVGAYAGNDAYLGPGNAMGVMAGTELPLARRLVHVMIDFVYGNNEASVGVAGLVFFLPQSFQLSVGVQFPSPMSDNAWGGVLEITRAPPGDVETT